MKISTFLVALGAMTLVGTRLCLAADCDPGDFEQHYKGKLSLSQAMALRDLKSSQNGQNDSGNSGLNVEYEGTGVGGSQSHDNSTYSNNLSDYQFDQSSNLDENVEAEYLSPLYASCLLYNAHGLRIQLVTGSPQDDFILLRGFWDELPGDLPKRKFIFTVSGSGTADPKVYNPFQGNGQADFSISTRNPEKQTVATIKIVNSRGDDVAADTIVIPARPHIWAPVSTLHQVQKTMNFSITSPAKGDEHTASWAVEDKNTIMTTGTAFWGPCSGGCDEASPAVTLAADKLSAAAHGKISTSGGNDAGATLYVSLGETTVAMQDVTDIPFAVTRRLSGPAKDVRHWRDKAFDVAFRSKTMKPDVTVLGTSQTQDGLGWFQNNDVKVRCYTIVRPTGESDFCLRLGEQNFDHVGRGDQYCSVDADVPSHPCAPPLSYITIVDDQNSTLR